MNFRKSKKIGPFRLNFSKSGVGVSTGVKGARIGINSKSTYIHVGYGGVYYRKNISNKKPQETPTQNPIFYDEGNREALLQNHLETSPPSELQRKFKKANAVSWDAYLLGGVVFFLVSSLGTVLALMWALAIFTLLRIFSRHRRRVNLQYDLDERGNTIVNSLEQILEYLNQSSRVWFIKNEKFEADWKKNAGANRSLDRVNTKISKTKPPNIKTNVPVWAIESTKGAKFFFLPDGLYILQNKVYGVFPYSQLKVQSFDTRFVEAEKIPYDSEIVGETWQYVNKRGGPDRRFKFNRRLPIANYGELLIETHDGLKLEFHVSNKEIASDVATGFNELITFCIESNTAKPKNDIPQTVLDSSPDEENLSRSLPKENGKNESFLKEALDQIASNVSILSITNIEQIPQKAISYVQEIQALLDFESSETKLLWVNHEIYRYKNRVDFVHPCYLMLIEEMIQNQVLSSDPIANHLQKISSKFETGNIYEHLYNIFYVLLLQNYLISKSGFLLGNIKTFEEFNKQLHKVRAKCVLNEVEIHEAVYLQSPLITLFDESINKIDKYTRARFLKKELRRTIAWCNSLMPKYKRWINNGADRLIQAHLDDARKQIKEIMGDITELQTIYNLLVDSPYNMLRVIKQHEKDTNLPIFNNQPDS